ncbi:uncharacterized protein K452DRAFT_309122 [Aplosporella prunicola CBS 121167]|uniref:SnoaL-like domain-containing protein n=1 Tax=Aplosporella prunicola CBS 121167 TaxID=1176127 RepID=A0A6A6BEJ4_9PEZI|nr:uncharacterized protein K452DRAFT_309122 [Aplosporella prunicola CBS 121167]KAF2141347.1 hypothetical protein K452DRAFT_309122 [Aplosporella prunicola CBS 121167]
MTLSWFFSLAIAVTFLCKAVGGSPPRYAPTQPTCLPGNSTGRANFTFDELYDLQSRFWDNFISPNNAIQAKSINSTLLAPDILGRVDATRTFDGQELNTEYLFGLFTDIETKQAVNLLGFPLSYEIVHFVGNQDIASAATIVTFRSAILGEFPMEIDTWTMFNGAGQIWQYDATFRWFDYLLDTTLAAASAAMGVKTTAEATTRLAKKLATGICKTAQKHCTGANRQYESFKACLTHLTRQVAFGTAYGLGRDTLLCRMVHEGMVPMRPAVHCAHIGPSGGGMCVDDAAYGERVLQPYFTHAPFVAYGRQSANETVAAM